MRYAEPWAGGCIGGRIWWWMCLGGSHGDGTMITDEEIKKLDYDQLANVIVQRCKNEDQLRAMIAETLEKVAMWSYRETRKELEKQ